VSAFRTLTLVALLLLPAVAHSQQRTPPPRAREQPPTLPQPALPAPAAAPPRVAAGVAPSGEDQRVREIIAAVSPQRIERDIRMLVSFGTRHTLSDTLSRTRGIGAARRWIFDEFTRISQQCGGCLEVRYISEVYPGSRPRLGRDVNIVNVVAIQRGGTDPNRYVLLSGDIDSRVTDVMNTTGESPGANDNATGVAATLEAARVLSRYPSDASIVYAALSGEEQGLYGGEIVARHAKANDWRITAVINNDMIGNIAGITGVVSNTTARVFAPGLHPATERSELQRILSTGGELDTPSRQLGRYIKRIADLYMPNLDVEMIYRLDRFARGGHHTPFFLEGFPAVRLMETHEHYDRQHQDLRTEGGRTYGDVIEGVDFPYAASITALDAAVLISLAWAPPPPEDVRISGAVQASTTLRWSAVDAPGLAGYRVYWRRPTDATWTSSRWAGIATEATLENIIIDNYFFGVAAVGDRGHESLVVFPRPAQR
jgi:Zn-dependent M28 family amino/carboxypeptidase